MARPRFSIAGLMVVVLVVGVSVAALRSASGVWAALLFTLTLAVLAVAPLGVVYRRARSRAFWLGFGLFGWGYLALCYGPAIGEATRPNLATTALLDDLRGRIGPAQPQMQWATTGSSIVFLDAATGLATTQNPTVSYVAGSSTIPVQALQPIQLWTNVLGSGGTEHFQRIGHCLFALIAALAGGGIARRFQASAVASAPPSRPQEAPCPTPPPPADATFASPGSTT
jgi:hypothetical protein